MTKIIYVLLLILSSLLLIKSTIYAQQLAVAVGNENTIGGGGAWDGTNFLLTIIGDSTNPYAINAQFVGPGPVLYGPRFSTGKIGSGTKMAFDGTNYLMLWTDPFPFFASGDTNGIGNIYGQFISKSGNLVGSTFNVASNVNIKFGQGRGTFSFNDSTYLVTYDKGGNHQDILYGQFISKSGNLIGSPIQISSNYAREHAISFDGTNFLIAWCEGSGVDESVSGQLLSNTGALVGNNFLIDGEPQKSDNPLSMAYDGTQYFVLYHKQAIDTTWNIYGRFVSKSGSVSGNRILICDSTKHPSIPSIACDGTDYLITWIEMSWPIVVKGEFFNKLGAPVDTAFIAFDTLGGKFPMGGVSGYIPGHYILGATFANQNFSDCDVYVKGIDPLVTAIKVAGNNTSPANYFLSQNYPNPFNPSTTIKFSVLKTQQVLLKVYDLLGREVATLVNTIHNPGVYEVNFNANSLTSGIYFYRMQAGNFVDMKKLILLK